MASLSFTIENKHFMSKKFIAIRKTYEYFRILRQKTPILGIFYKAILLSIAYFAALLKKSDLLVVSLLIDFSSFSGRITLTLTFFSTGAGSLISSPSAINTSSKQEKASICTRKGSAAAKKDTRFL